MLWRRSASLTRITRRSRLIASIILRKFSAASSSLERNLSLPILVTPSTSSVISGPISASIWALVIGLSSRASCSSAVAIVSTSILSSARMPATASGWVR
jgi:hypothetical protein